MMIVADATCTIVPKLATALQNGDVIVSPEGIFTEVYTVIDPSPKATEFVDVVTDKGTFWLIRRLPRHILLWITDLLMPTIIDHQVIQILRKATSSEYY